MEFIDRYFMPLVIRSNQQRFPPCILHMELQLFGIIEYDESLNRFVLIRWWYNFPLEEGEKNVRLISANQLLDTRMFWSEERENKQHSMKTHLDFICSSSRQINKIISCDRIDVELEH